MYHAKKADDINTIFYSKFEIAGLYARNLEHKKAITEFEWLIAFAKKNKLVQNEADVYINYVNTLIAAKEDNKALQIAIFAEEFSKKNKFLYNENIFVIKIYEIYKSQGNLERANAYLEQRLKLSERYYKFEWICK